MHRVQSEQNPQAHSFEVSGQSARINVAASTTATVRYTSIGVLRVVPAIHGLWIPKAFHERTLAASG